MPRLLFPHFFCVWDPDSCQRVVFFGREDGVTSTGVVITMRTLLSPDYAGSRRKREKERKKMWGVPLKYEIYVLKLIPEVVKNFHSN